MQDKELVLDWLIVFNIENKLADSNLSDEEWEIWDAKDYHMDLKNLKGNPTHLLDDDCQPIRRQVPLFEAQDPMMEVNLWTSEEPWMTKVSGLLT